MNHLTRRCLGVAVLALATLLASAQPAAAHGVGGVEPTNYATTITRVDPSLRDVRVEVVDLGSRLQVTNTGPRDVVVLGYDGEPYLRVGPRGVFENTRSPATSLNRARIPTGPPPAGADPDAPPRWRKVSDGNVARWHDHRAHWMGSAPPPSVRRDPGERQVIDEWSLELLRGDRTITVQGTLTWVPPPSPWPAALAAVAVGALVLGLSRTRWWRAVLVGALGALLLCTATLAVGHWTDSVGGLGTKLAESAYAIAGIGIGLVALGWARRRGVDAAVPGVLVAAVFLLATTGLADLATIGHSLVPSSLPATAARFAVALVIGLSSGLTAAAALRLREAPPGRTPARPPAVAPDAATAGSRTR